MKKGSSCYFCFVTVKSNLCETCKKLIITELNPRKKKQNSSFTILNPGNSRAGNILFTHNKHHCHKKSNICMAIF